MKRNLRLTGLAVAILMTLATASQADMYSGSLSVAGGTGDGLLVATQMWNDPTTTLSWVVDNTTTPGKWHYEYTLSVPVRGISHMLIEVSDDDPGPAFTSANLFSPSSDPAGWIASPINIQLWTDQQGNPGLPGPMYGMKLNSAFEATLLTVSFDSDRVPVWGDFYAKDGEVRLNNATYPVLLYNNGYLLADPIVAPHNGSEQDHLLVPDSAVVPLPGAVVLGMLGMSVAGWRLRRFA